MQKYQKEFYSLALVVVLLILFFIFVAPHVAPTFF